MEFGEASRESEFVVLKERRLVPRNAVYDGMLRFSFLLETCQPGSVPDHYLMAAILDLVKNILFLKLSITTTSQPSIFLLVKFNCPTLSTVIFI